jgi:2-octaprenylphenol hydroxylase
MAVSDGNRFELTIIGAGIAGSALAVALAGLGLRIALVEAQPLDDCPLPRAPDPHVFDPRVSALTPRSQAQLRQLGAWQDIADYRYCRYRHMTVWDAEGTGIIDFDCSEVSAGQLGYIVENRAITNALLRQVRGAEDITLFNPASLARCERLASGSIEVVLDDGTLLDTGLLVAADGASSRVREMFKFATREWDYGHRAIVTTAQVEKPHQDTAWQRFLPSGPLAFLPLPDTSAEAGHYCSIVWSLQEKLVDRLLQMDEPAFCAELAAAFESRLGRVLACSERFAFPLRQRHAVDYIQPGVVLVADAAHTIHPLAGQGINLGLHDVAVLAEEVAETVKRGGEPGQIATLRRYQRRRKGENLLMMTAMDGFKRLFEQQALPLRWLRNAGMRGVASSGPLKHELMRRAMGLERG